MSTMGQFSITNSTKHITFAEPTQEIDTKKNGH